VASNESKGKTFVVALALCLVCSVVVSSAAVLLKDAQVANKALDKQKNILQAAGMYKDGVDVVEQFEQITAKLVDLRTGKFSQDITIDKFDQRKAAKDPSISLLLSEDEDLANISRRENYALVYLVEKQGELDKVILPVHGYGLWSTLYGFVALEQDANTVAGLGFFEHGETPGLGGEVDNPRWKAMWPGKQIYSEQGVAISLIKGTVDTSRKGSKYQVDGLSGATLTSKGVTNLLQFWLGDNGFGPFLHNLREGEA